MWQTMWAVGVGGFIGANSRYWLGYWIGSQGFPVATLAINLLGCLGLAFFATYISEKRAVAEWVRHLIAPGFFGAFTTFSTFNLEAMTLLRDGKNGLALLYILLSVLGGLIAGGIGMGLARLG